jgi:hypothetical protein
MSVLQDVMFEKKVDIGHILTLLTLVFGFLAWLFATRKQRSAAANEEAKSGALRLLLRLLRARNGAPMRLDDLREAYNSVELKDDRVAYCGTNFLFKTKPQFDGAVYRLDWEGKIRFVGPDEIVFRIDAASNPRNQFLPDETDKSRILAVLKRDLANTSVNIWEVERMAESCMRVAPAKTADLLREALRSEDEALQRRAVQVLRDLVPAGITS